MASTNTEGYAKSITSDVIDPNNFRAGAFIELNLDGRRERFTVSHELADAMDDATSLDAKRNILLGGLKQFAEEVFGTANGGAASPTNPARVNVKLDAGRLVFETQAGRNLSISNFGNAYTPSLSATYNPSNINDELKFEVDGREFSVFTDGLDTAEDLANAINAALLALNPPLANLGGVDPSGSGLPLNFRAVASGNTITFQARSQDESFRLIETTGTDALFTGGTFGTRSFTYNRNDIADTLEFTVQNATDTYTINVGTLMDNATLPQIQQRWVDNDGRVYRWNTDDNRWQTTSGGQVMYIDPLNGNLMRVVEGGSDTGVMDANNQQVTINITAPAQFRADRLTAEELAARINTALGAHLPPLASTEFGVVAVGNSIRFENRSYTDNFRVMETTDTDTGARLTNFGTTGAVLQTGVELFGKTTSVFGVTRDQTTGNTEGRTILSEFGAVNLSAMRITSPTGTNRTLAELGLTQQSTIEEMATAINGANLGVRFSFDAVTGQYAFEATKTGANGRFTLDGFAAVAAVVATPGFRNLTVPLAGSLNYGQDAVFLLNGVSTTRETNEFEVAGMRIELNSASLNAGEITLRAGADIDGVVKNIREFIDNYNRILLALTTAFNEPRARTGSFQHYEPLLDEEKGSLSDREVDLWEEKARQGMLSRDPSIGRLIDSMRGVMGGRIFLRDEEGEKRKNANGTDMTIGLADIGISSTSWRDRGVLSIDEDKLRQALAERPEDVERLFNQSEDSFESEFRLPANATRRQRDERLGLAYLLDNALNDAIRTSPVAGRRGYFIDKAGMENTATVSQNEMSFRIRDINARIIRLEGINFAKENSFYQMFARMEKAMMQAQNQMAMMGGGMFM
jgi:flagellar capping protein FliD